MCENFVISSSSAFSSIKIKNYLVSELQEIINIGRPIIFICIGTDRSTGDSLGPLVGHKLQYFVTNNIYIYGTLENPIHAKNLAETLDRINCSFKDPYIIGVDSCLGCYDNVGKIFIQKKPLRPGLALDKKLPPVGEMSITGIVNVSGCFDFLVLQNTRLHIVMNLADSISRGIHYFILNSIHTKIEKSI